MNHLRKLLKSKSPKAIAAQIILFSAGLILPYFSDRIPYYAEILATAISIAGVVFVYKRLTNNKEYAGAQYLRLRHEQDSIEKFLSLSAAILLLLGAVLFIVANGEVTGGNIFCMIASSLLFFNYLTYQNSVVLKKEASKIVYLDDPEVQIEMDLINKIKIYPNQIIVEDKGHQPSFLLYDLDLKHQENDMVLEQIRSACPRLIFQESISG